jgi:hypothetical protein
MAGKSDKHDDVHVAAARLVRLHQTDHSMNDWNLALEGLQNAVGVKGDPSPPEVVENEDGSVTTTYWDGTVQRVDAAGTSSPRTTVSYVVPWVAPEEPIVDPGSGARTHDVDPKEAAEAAKADAARDHETEIKK